MGHKEQLPSFLQEQDDDHDDAGDYENDDGNDYDNEDSDDDDDNNEPIEYLYGDLDIKIINAKGMVNCKELINYLEDTKFKKSVDVDIRLYNNIVACSQISHNQDHSLQVSLAHPVESNLEVQFNFMMGSQTYNGVVTLPCRDIDAYNEFDRWFPVSCRGFIATVKRLSQNKDKDKNDEFIEVQLQVKFTPFEDNLY